MLERPRDPEQCLTPLTMAKDVLEGPSRKIIFLKDLKHNICKLVNPVKLSNEHRPCLVVRGPQNKTLSSTGRKVDFV